MGRFHKDSKKAKMKADLINKFERYARLSISDISEDYFNPKTLHSSIVAKNTTALILSSIKHFFKKEGIPFGSLNDQDKWGIPREEEEYKYALKKRYKNVKGTVINSETLWVTSAKKAGYLKDLKHEKMLVAKQENGE